MNTNLHEEGQVEGEDERRNSKPEIGFRYDPMTVFRASCAFCGSSFPMIDIFVSGTNGVISWLMNNTFFAMFIFRLNTAKVQKNY